MDLFNHINKLISVDHGDKFVHKERMKKGVIGLLTDYKDDVEQVKSISLEGWDRL